MTVLVYLLELTSTGSVGERATPAGPFHIVFTVTVTGASTDESTTTVQVRMTVVPTVTMPGGLEVMLTVGGGTKEREREREREREHYKN